MSTAILATLARDACEARHLEQHYAPQLEDEFRVVLRELRKQVMDRAARKLVQGEAIGNEGAEIGSLEEILKEWGVL